MAQDQDFNTGTGASVAAFALGLLAGAAIGVGLGMLFAPKEGAELRRDLAKRARTAVATGIREARLHGGGVTDAVEKTEA